MSESRIKSLAKLLSPEHAENTAVIFPDRELTYSYRTLGEKVARLRASLLSQGLQAGDVVVLALHNGAEFLLPFLAITCEGAIALPVNPAFTEEELRFAIEDSGAGFVIGKEHGSAEQAANLCGARYGEAVVDSNGNVEIEFRTGNSGAASDRTGLHGVAMILYTSGTTSKPKAVPLTHSNLAASVHYFSRWFGLTADDSTMVVMPPFHVHGLIGVTLSTLYTGGTAVIPPKFSASAFWKQVADHNVTWYSATPTIHQILLMRADSDGAPRSVLRFIRSSSAKLPPAVRAQMEDRFGTVVIEAYGMTEAANQISANPLPPGLRKTGSVGLPAGAEVAIFKEHNVKAAAGEEGEVCVRGANMLAGYRNNEDANAKSFIDGWFRTGDQGYLDEDGYLHLSGRIKELISRGGEKVSPLEIESVLLEHPSVREAVCFGVPHEKYGEEIEAAIVPAEEANLSEIMDFMKERLAEYKLPKRIHVMQELPRNALNKVQRNTVAALCLQATQSSSS